MKQRSLFAKPLRRHRATCIQCGREFKQQRTWQRLCSVRCGTRYYGYPSPEFPFAKDILP
jgi:hypothetical protein